MRHGEQQGQPNTGHGTAAVVRKNNATLPAPQACMYVQAAKDRPGNHLHMPWPSVPNLSKKRKNLASGALAIAVRVPYNPCQWCEGPSIAHQEELWHTTLARFDSKWESSQSSV